MAQIDTDNGETILLVDDEESIRDISELALSKFGYTVITVPDGERALAVYRQRKGQIDLVILDVAMPGMGGRRCLAELLKVNPQVKVIVASGSIFNNAAEEIMAAGARAFVNKPFTMREMRSIIRDVLDND